MATPVHLLQLSPTMTEGTIVKWLVKEGDEVTSGQPIAEVETDKAVMEQESFDDGKVLKITAKAGERIAVESLIMVIGKDGEDVSSFTGEAPKAEKKAEKPAPKAEAPAKKEEPKSAPAAAAPKQEAPKPAAPAPPAKSGGRILASPLARKMAEEANLDLARVNGSGPNGRIIREDVEKAIQGGGAAAATSYEAPSEETRQVSVSGMRQTIARRLTESKQTVPHFPLTVEVRGEKLLEAVKRLKEIQPDAKVTVTHFLIKAMATMAMKHEAIRSQWAGNVINVIGGAHISVAVAIDVGLVTPVIRNVQRKGVVQIAQELRELAEKARARKLTAEDMSGGVQTLSNLGMYGIHEFGAIINIPESSILAVGAMEDRPVVEAGQIKPGKVMNITMSCDHRVLDGAVGAAYLADLKQVLEEPVLLLM